MRCKRIPGLFRLLCLPLMLVLCLSAAGCGRRESAPADPTPQPAAALETSPAVVIGGREYALDATAVTAVLSDGDTALLDRLPALRTADLSGSGNVREIAAWAAMHPGVDVTWTVRLPDGGVLDSRAETADLSACSGEELADAIEALSLLPALRHIDLGVQRPGLDWDGVAALRAAFPTLDISYRFNLYDTECSLSDDRISLYHVPVDDDGVLLEKVMDLMPKLTYVDLDSCDLPMWRCEEIHPPPPGRQGRIPRLVRGKLQRVRTDVEKILASKPSVGGDLTVDNVEGLYYCHDVKYLDVGHNVWLSDIGFVAEMPKLEVAVLAMCNWVDATPLSHCPELEYLEIFDTLCDDLSPLSGLSKLRYLNVCNIGVDQVDGPPRRLTDITPLYPLTGLKRLWIGGINPVPPEQVEEYLRLNPKCEIDVSVSDPTGGDWRYIDYDYQNYMHRSPTTTIRATSN